MIVLTALAVVGVPLESWRTDPVDPCHLAALAGLAVVVLLFAARMRGGAAAFERSVLVAFLAGMPLVYVASWLWVTPRDDTAWLAVEAIGVPIYVALAIAGLRRSPWLLVAGIAAHGIGWDLWHHAHATYIPHWYATGCFLMDIGVAIYAAACVPRWREAHERRAAARLAAAT